jgi:hypothetical protein
MAWEVYTTVDATADFPIPNVNAADQNEAPVGRNLKYQSKKPSQ